MKINRWLESLTLEKILLSILAVLIAAISLGFCIGTGAEYSLRAKPVLQYVSDDYKSDLIQQDDLRKEILK